jgi:large subunit ribosomal protein L15
MRLHDLRPPAGSKRPRKRVGRGPSSGTGKTAGRGTKGQKARGTVPPWFEGGQIPIQRRVPKWGGFTSRNRVSYDAVNVSRLEEVFEAGASVGPEEMASKGLVGRKAKVKVLAQGDLSKALQVRAHAFSKQATEKIKAAGGSTEVV